MDILTCQDQHLGSCRLQDADDTPDLLDRDHRLNVLNPILKRLLRFDMFCGSKQPKELHPAMFTYAEVDNLSDFQQQYGNESLGLLVSKVGCQMLIKCHQIYICSDLLLLTLHCAFGCHAGIAHDLKFQTSRLFCLVQSQEPDVSAGSNLSELLQIQALPAQVIATASSWFVLASFGTCAFLGRSLGRS